jgi:hypothetical protein
VISIQLNSWKRVFRLPKLNRRERLSVAALWVTAGCGLAYADHAFTAMVYGFMAGHDLATIYQEHLAEQYRELLDSLLDDLKKAFPEAFKP